MGRRRRWAALLGVALLLAYGAPVILSGQATVTGYLKLDDTATLVTVGQIRDHHLQQCRRDLSDCAQLLNRAQCDLAAADHPLSGLGLLEQSQSRGYPRLLSRRTAAASAA